jgi:diguanylate cyclase (GGDEF)-like protein/PAS domain S-box-containing protein
MTDAMKKRSDIKVLLVEDGVDDAELLLAEMRRRGLPVVSRRVESEPEYTAALRDFAPQLILSDYTLPNFDGPLALRIAKQQRPDTPFIFVSGTIGEERAIDALQQGAVDYVLKDNRARLVPAIERALKEADDREARRQALRQLQASEERFRSISEATREWIWEMDSRGVYTYSSPAVEAMIGYRPQDLLGKNCLDLVSATLRPQLAELLRRGVMERTGWRDLVLHLRHSSGGIRCFRMAWIGLVKRGAARATPLIWEGYDQGYLAAVNAAMGGEDDDTGPVGAAIRDKTMIVVNDIETDPRIVAKSEALERGYRSMIAMPLLVADEAVGVLALYADETGFFDHEELKLLKDLAGDISFALDYIGKEERVAYVSYYDTLTGLPNRQLFFDRLAQGLNAARAEGRALAIMIIDVLGFKRVNDTLGRHAGDRVLKELAIRLERTTVESAAPARIGGDRFAVVAPNLSAANVARWTDEWIVDSFAEPLTVDGVELRTSVKVGIALFPSDANTAETLFVNAEAALQRATGGADPYVFYSPEMNARIAERLHVESRLRKALNERQFVLHYQTKIDLATRRILGLEALIRWNDPEAGLVLPGDFVPVLEESGLIIEVGRWVIEQAAADIQSWRDRGLHVPRVAVNVSEVQLRHPNFVPMVLKAIGYPNVLDAGIDLEITETMLARDAGTNVQKLSHLRAAGMQVFMDDFGTGYSGLSQIARLPIDALKIDRAFIANMTTSTEHMAIVSTIINLAKALNMFVVAEGVETEEQAQRLQVLGCDQAQGYLYSYPVPVGQTAQALAARLPPR